MKKQICIISLLLTCRICDAQNLVPNGDFEQYIGCPTFLNQLDSALYWFNPAPSLSGSSPDYFNQCSNPNAAGVPDNAWGFQYAKSGGGYGGILLFALPPILPNYRENIETPLTSMLIANVCYHFEMYINLANVSKYTTDNIGIYFSDTAITGINTYLPLPFTPQINNTAGNLPDTLNWTLVSGNFIAAGGESYLIIGNFKDDSNTDTLLVNSNGGPVAYVYIDDVSLSLCTGINEQGENQTITIYPNPTKDKLNVTVTNKEFSEIILYDIASRKILQQKFTNSVSLNTEQLANGLYLYEVKSKDGSCKKGKVVKD